MMRGDDNTNYGGATGPDEVWAAIQTLIPANLLSPTAAGPRIQDRARNASASGPARGSAWLPSPDSACASGNGQVGIH
jgi:hypothetical protein